MADGLSHRIIIRTTTPQSTKLNYLPFEHFAKVGTWPAAGADAEEEKYRVTLENRLGSRLGSAILVTNRFGNFP